MPPNRRGGGIRKRQQQRKDRDGDLVMNGEGPRAVTRPPRAPGSKTASFVELRVTGWTDAGEKDRIIKFLEKHASRRSTTGKSGGATPKMVKRSSIAGETLTISVRPEDVPSFSKINGFSFSSSHGNQKITISGPGIRAKGEATESTPAPSNELSALFTAFLARRYNPDEKLLNLSSIAEDEEISKAGLFEKSSTTSKFFPALMAVLDLQFKTADEKAEAIQSVTLSNNNLPDLSKVRELGITLPRIKNLDLSGNSLTKAKDLLMWKSKLQQLDYIILSGNPLETSQTGWQQELMGYFPRLRIIDGQTVRTDAEIAKLDAPKHTPMPATGNSWHDGDKIAESFVIDFIQGFDNDRNALLAKYYDDGSTFAMNVNSRAKGGVEHDKTPWDAYLPQSRNLKAINGKRARFSRRYHGVEQIQKVWSAIPPTRHPALDTNQYSMDCQPQPGLPDPTGQYPGGVTGLMVIMHGQYEEHRTAKGANEIVRRAFDRTFVLGPGGPSGVRVVSDMCSLRAAGGAPSWIPLTPAAPVEAQSTRSTSPTTINGQLTPEQQAMVMHVHQATKLTIDMATQCLQAGNWDLNTAAQIFEAQKASLSPDAFVP